jgi:hypothetical protein
MFTFTKAQPILAGDLGTKPVDLVVVTLDADHPRAVDERVQHLALLQVRSGMKT